MENNENLIGQEILKIRQNKVLAKYLDDTQQWLQVGKDGLIIFQENKLLRRDYGKNGDYGWGVLAQPIIPQHPAQHQDLSE